MKRYFKENYPKYDYSGYSVRDRVVRELMDIHDTADLRVVEKERLDEIITTLEYAESDYDYKEAVRLADELADDMSEVFPDEAEAIWDAMAEIRQGLESNAKEFEEFVNRKRLSLKRFHEDIDEKTKEDFVKEVQEFAARELIDYEGYLLDDYEPKKNLQEFLREIKNFVDEGEEPWYKLSKEDLLGRDFRDLYRVYSSTYNEIFNKVKNGRSWYN